jgi:ceramide glucosyltransferase
VSFCHDSLVKNCPNFSVKEDTLCDMVRCMKDNVGLVHQMPYICDRTGFPSILEKVSFFVTVTFELLATVLYDVNFD